MITFERMNEKSEMHKMTSSGVRLRVLLFKRVPSLIVFLKLLVEINSVSLFDAMCLCELSLERS